MKKKATSRKKSKARSTKKPARRTAVRVRKVAPPVAPPAIVIQAADVPPVGRDWPEQKGVHIGEIVGEDGKPNSRLIQLMNPDGTPVTVEGTWGARGKQIGASSIRDGMANTEKMLAEGSELAKAARAHGADCYIPSDGENFLIRTNNPKVPRKGLFWTSTEDGATSARCQDFESGHSHWGIKRLRLSAFVVRRVPIQVQ